MRTSATVVVHWPKNVMRQSYEQREVSTGVPLQQQQLCRGAVVNGDIADCQTRSVQ